MESNFTAKLKNYYFWLFRSLSTSVFRQVNRTDVHLFTLKHTKNNSRASDEGERVVGYKKKMNLDYTI
jgi:hypothetical protein